MNKIVILFCLIVSIGFSEVPDVIMKDIQGKEYNVHALLAEGKHIAFYMLSKTWLTCPDAVSINNEVYEEWGENRNDIIYLQYWIGNEEDEAQAYTDTYGVEMPTVTWDMGGTGNNLTLGAAMVKATTGIWKGGTHYIITPDHEFMNIGEGNFREFLEDSLKIGKGDEVPVLSQRIDNLFSVSILNSNKLQFSVSESGKYGYSLLNLKGQTLRSSNDLTLQKGELVSIEYEGLAKQVAILQITSPIGVICETVFLR